MKNICILLFLLFPTSFVAFSQENEEILYQDDNYTFPYGLNNPHTNLKLPKILKEISGLSSVSSNILAAVQDEKGIVFFIDCRSGEITEEIKMYENGDYEGLEVVGDDIWMIKSNGTLYRIKNYNSKKNEVKKYKTELSSRNNSEGLGYDPFTKQLLIACKGHPLLKHDKKGKHVKNIYAYDTEEKLVKDPYLSINIDSLKQYIDHNSMAKAGLRLLSFFDPSMGDLTFQPSGIAIHPISKNIYVLGSTGKMLLIYNQEKDLQAMIKLKKSLFPQAEGICFDEKGNLFISNEGKDKKATLLKFLMKE